MSEETISEEVLKKIEGEIISTTTVPTIELDAIDEETTVFNSKIGGKPYLPKNFEYPMTRGNAPHPLVLLAQLNFEEFEALEDFPTVGILQFYIDGNSDMSGMNFHDLTNTNGFRVIYHEKIITDESLLVDPPEIKVTNVPFEKCCKLIGKKVSMTMTSTDFRMKELVKKQASKYEIDEWDLHDILAEGDCLSTSKTRIGGYGGFAQEDPRTYAKQYSNYVVNLFTSETTNGIMWGDSGVANFFIKKEDLLKKNFNDVLYTWDCC
ncbi:DUF1963 domain-containing protein [Entamoeba marina]